MIGEFDPEIAIWGCEDYLSPDRSDGERFLGWHLLLFAFGCAVKQAEHKCLEEKKMERKFERQGSSYKWVCHGGETEVSNAARPFLQRVIELRSDPLQEIRVRATVFDISRYQGWKSFSFIQKF